MLDADASASCSVLQAYFCSEPTASLLGLATLASCAAPSGDPAPTPAPGPAARLEMERASLSSGPSPECGRSKSSEPDEPTDIGTGADKSCGLEAEPCCTAAIA